MSARALQARLIDFSAPPRPVKPNEPAPPPRDVDGEIAAARTNGYTQGRRDALEEADRAWEHRLQETETRAQCLLVEARETWCESAAALSAEQLARSVDEAEAAIADAAARILVEIATIARKPALIEDVAARLKPLLRDPAVTRVDLSGPLDLMAALESKMDGEVIGARTPSPIGDLRVTIDRTVLQTRLEEWRASLIRILES